MKILALDLGTSSARAMVLDAAAQPLPGALARRPVVVTQGRDGAATLNVEIYLAAVVDCLDELAAGGWLDGVELVVSAAQWHSLLPLDAAGAPLGPVMVWLDTRAEVPDGAVGPADPDAFHQRTGTWWHRAYWTVRVPWLRARLGTTPARFVGIVEYVLSVLLTDAPMSVSQASGTGLLDLTTLDWDGEACDLAGVRPGELPSLAPEGWRGRLRAEYARRWPALREAWWAPAIGDGAASNIGSGCVDESRAAVTVGTSSAVRLVQAVPAGEPLPPLPDMLWRYRVDHRRVVTGSAFSSGGNLFAWARRELRLPDGPELDAALERVQPGRGLWADPRFGGDRPPGQAPAGSGQLVGLSFDTTAVDVLAALMNGVCQQICGALSVIESTVRRQVDVVLGGGALAASRWWRQAFQAALAPRSVRRIANPEIAATGAGLLALGLIDDPKWSARAIGWMDDVDSPGPTGRDQPATP